MTAKYSTLKKPIVNEFIYSRFDLIDGQHPWMKAVPEGYVPYRVRKLNAGKVAYFNFALAKEMGLITDQHPNAMNSQLEEKILETFSLQIINEYDELTKRRFSEEDIKPNKYMATRYLQLQHSNKKGTTSGDGRGIWNGTIQYNGTTWDISSRGTGVTKLSPGAVQANRPLKTGGTEFGYGCGQAELDELFGAALSAETMHLQGIPTERVLCIIDLGKGYGIGVRAAPNLIRPAHLFLYLKQQRLKELKSALDYFIQRQEANKRIKISSTSKTNKYDQFFDSIVTNFAEFTAKLDIDYIFAWLDWDGDNVLADAGIIDYGSIRQFGIRHDRYRYDDVERFSTNLNEQRNKAKLIVQVFAQLIDYVKSGNKKPLKVFQNHPTVLAFNNRFAEKRAQRLLYRMGFNSSQRNRILNQNKELFNQFDRKFSSFERAKVSGASIKVPDGINHPALYNMRSILKDLPYFFLTYFQDFQTKTMDEQIFFNKILSSFAKSKDARISESKKKSIIEFQNLYKKLIVVANANGNLKNTLEGITERAALLNSENRITGNALIEIIEEIIEESKRKPAKDHYQKIIDDFILDHVGFPEVKTSRYYRNIEAQKSPKSKLYDKLLTLIKEHQEDI